MLLELSSTSVSDSGRASSWGGVFALSLGAFALVASEFMPVSLLTPIAADLQITEGQAGQAISVSGAFAVLTSLLISAVAGQLDRKLVLLVLTALMIISGTIVAMAPNYEIFMVGRAFVGIAIGGFWSMSAATAMRLVPSDQVPRALSILNGGNALATVIAAPLGSFLGGFIGWRGAFFFVVPIAAIVFIWQLFSLPSMKTETRTSVAGVFLVLKRPVVALGMAAVSIFFMGQFALFTYLRPFLETVEHVDVSTLSLVLLMMGVTGFVGTSLIGAFLKDRLYRTIITIPVIMALIAGALVLSGTGVAMTTLLLSMWGLFATAAPVGWWTWVARTLPNDAEAGGGLMVAVVQLAITFGAVVGGILFDTTGYQATFGASTVLLLIAAVLTALTARSARTDTQNA
ncbi:MFS transporter (plasmid) [Rhizobium leguminosarum]|jgi:predicted MFS family arabinose efflux permease|uniref:MFS transporter n=1 Tax=Rhizobium leguminosarum TaxID=384 RepID=A0A7M3DT67_RHILE|nr:MFS transporter [Rhizobium leguminosarum]MDH6661881.1 putative MFS family arabinose efflux permease [Rhizobium sophorae]MBB4524938.1 putative MFS family arabinose efflux permease [Rhizobium leguminosarum]MBP2490728.1 putative MFS family arabinose efflux permease [Rhizobium leguminosarum]MBY5474442.1 MFS transporter [Rhizobium leguminosarum]MBY5509965.1 MFS transporter [Rhizobium leguminosarum]